MLTYFLGLDEAARRSDSGRETVKPRGTTKLPSSTSTIITVALEASSPTSNTTTITGKDPMTSSTYISKITSTTKAAYIDISYLFIKE